MASSVSVSTVEFVEILCSGKNLRIFAQNSKQSEKIQKALFHYGYRWITGNDKLQEFTNKVIFFVVDRTITWSNNEEFIINDKNYTDVFVDFAKRIVFSNNSQVFSHLLAGFAITKFAKCDYYYEIGSNGFIVAKDKLTDRIIDKEVSIVISNKFNGAFVSYDNVNTPWYMDIPKCGILCTITNYNNDKIIRKIIKNQFMINRIVLIDDSGYLYELSDVVPLTQSAIDKGMVLQ